MKTRLGSGSRRSGGPMGSAPVRAARRVWAGPFRTKNRCPIAASGATGFFSVRTGTALERSKVPLKKWAYTIYLSVTSLKGVSSMKLHRDIGVTQKTAWFMAHRIREAWGLDDDAPPFAGPVEVDGTYMGGKEKNRHASKKLQSAASGKGRGGGIKAARQRGRGQARREHRRADSQVLCPTEHAKGAEISPTITRPTRAAAAHAFNTASASTWMGWRTRTESRASGHAEGGYQGTYHKMSGST